LLDKNGSMQKTILITGATSGFGKAIAYLFAKQEFNIIITGRRQERLAEIEIDLKNKYPTINIQTLCFDVRDREACILQLASIDKTKFSTLDIVVNNAGLAAGFGTIDEGEYADWDAMIDTNVKGLLNVTKEIIPILKAQGHGHIINISSIAGKTVYPKGNVYCASKHAVDALSKAMRIDLLPYNIKVTCINPGAAETEFSVVRFNGDEAKAKNVYEGFTPLTANDIADATYYVANLPAHVCVNDLTITCITQANSHYNIKK
jgi:3-hydroxy acid dehydrogenase / malonic semialdehyde reductase